MQNVLAYKKRLYFILFIPSNPQDWIDILTKVLRQPEDGDLNSALMEAGRTDIPSILSMDLEEIAELRNTQTKGKRVGSKEPIVAGLRGLIKAFKGYVWREVIPCRLISRRKTMPLFLCQSGSRHGRLCS